MATHRTVPQKPLSVGKTKDAGYEAGVRRTFPVDVPMLWESLVSEVGLSVWLGSVRTEDLQVGIEFSVTGGIEVKVAVFVTESHMRLRWKQAGWKKASTLQVRVLPSGNNATLSFHQENLSDAEVRSHMIEHWTRVLDEFEKLLASNV